MGRQRTWRRTLGRWLVSVGLTGGAGCCHLHSVQPPAPEWSEPCSSVPLCARNHVYVFFLHGLDPLDFSNLSGVHDYVRSLGFHKTYYGQLYHRGYFEKEMRRLHREEPNARFVLVGFSYGANKIRDLAQAVKSDGIHIDLLVYIGGNTLKNAPQDRPENAARIVNILAEGCVWNGAELTGAENVHVRDTWHFGSPSHQYTLEILARDLAAVAASVPVTLPPEPAMPGDAESAPTPRPVPAPTNGPRDEWDFLKPVPRLDQPMPRADDQGGGGEGARRTR